MNLEKILELLNSSHLKELHEYLLNYNAVDIAEILSECNDHDLAIIFRVALTKDY